MVKFTVTTRLSCSASTYITDKDSAVYKKFHMEKLGTLETEVLSSEVLDGPDGPMVKTVVRTVPGIKLPRIVRPVLRGKEVEFRDTRTFSVNDAGKFPFVQTFRTVNNITDRAVVEGRITIDQADGGSGTVLHVEGECVVRISGLGGKIESIIVENLKNSYRKLPEIIDEWMSVRASLLTGEGASPNAKPKPLAPRTFEPRVPTDGTSASESDAARLAQASPPTPPSTPPRSASSDSLRSFASANSDMEDGSGSGSFGASASGGGLAAAAAASAQPAVATVPAAGVPALPPPPDTPTTRLMAGEREGANVTPSAVRVNGLGGGRRGMAPEGSGFSTPDRPGPSGFRSEIGPAASGGAPQGAAAVDGRQVSRGGMSSAEPSRFAAARVMEDPDNWRSPQAFPLSPDTPLLDKVIRGARGMAGSGSSSSQDIDSADDERGGRPGSSRRAAARGNVGHARYAGGRRGGGGGAKCLKSRLLRVMLCCNSVSSAEEEDGHSTEGAEKGDSYASDDEWSDARGYDEEDSIRTPLSPKRRTRRI